MIKNEAEVVQKKMKYSFFLVIFYFIFFKYSVDTVTIKPIY